MTNEFMTLVTFAPCLVLHCLVAVFPAVDLHILLDFRIKEGIGDCESCGPTESGEPLLENFCALANLYRNKTEHKHAIRMQRAHNHRCSWSSAHNNPRELFDGKWWTSQVLT